MDRLQKKCFIASVGAHALLALILFIGPAFQSSTSKTDNLPVLEFIPDKTFDALVSGGGNPQAQPLAAPPAPQPKPLAPPPPQPQPQPEVQPPPPAPRPRPAPQPEKIREPEPPKETVKEAKSPKLDPESLELSKDRKTKKPEISTKLVTRTQRDTKAEAKAQADAQAREDAQAATDARRRLARQIGRMAEHLGGEVSGATTIELKGPGGGGVPYANFLQAVKSVYERAWLLPDGVTDEDATVAVSVTIARDGTVVSARITRSSGNAAVDRSVQATLDRVKYAAPLPDDAKENERTVGISFNVKAKRALG
jgi:colicin import membrane protein